MLPAVLGNAERPLRRLLALGAHADDIEIGAGGTIARLIASVRRLEVGWVVLSADGARAEEARASVEALVGNALRLAVIERFRDGFFPYEGAAIKECFEALKGRFEPDVILTPCREDRHQDHRLVSDLTWNTFRDHLILEYEIPKYDGDLGAPNLYVALTAADCQRKLEHLRRYFPSQRGRHWFDDELFRGLLRLRGMEARAPSGYAEAFYARKLVL